MENVQTPTELAAAQEEKIRQLEQQLAESQKQSEKAVKEKAKLEKEKAILEEKNNELQESLEKEKTSVSVPQTSKGTKMVTIKLFKDNKEYKDDLTVLVNGVAYKVQRGIPVEVPDFVAEVIEHSATQDAKTAELIEKLVAESGEPK